MTPREPGREEFSIALAHEAVCDAVPDREALVWRDRRLTYHELRDRSRRLATYLHGRGLGAHRERSQLAGHESGQDHVALYLYNGNEYLETMLGCFKSRTVPINVNYRYVADELRYLFRDARPRAVVYGLSFAATLAGVRDALPDEVVLLHVEDGQPGQPGQQGQPGQPGQQGQPGQPGRGGDPLPGSVAYEEALASCPADLPVQPSPDDLYALYTGGTTGMPKGVLWRSHDVFLSCMGGRVPGVWDAVTSYDQVRERARAGGLTLLVVPPFMHGAAQWAAFTIMGTGGKVVLPSEVRQLDPADVLRTCEREGVHALTVVGDAVVRPLLDELERGSYDLSQLVSVGNGGAQLTPAVKERILELLPHVLVSDSVGSSETGAQATHLSARGAVTSMRFAAGPGAVVLSADLSRVLQPGALEVGWLGQTGWVPLGYLGDPDKTAHTFPTLDGVRYSVPGDRARLLPDGSIELLGRDSVTINTGGEKVFAEEVEAAVASHPCIQDVVVVGRPSPRWGSEVVAVVQLAASVPAEELAAHAAQHLARYKLPKAWVVVDRVQRSPSGKADYRWARKVAQVG